MTDKVNEIIQQLQLSMRSLAVENWNTMVKLLMPYGDLTQGERITIAPTFGIIVTECFFKIVVDALLPKDEAKFYKDILEGIEKAFKYSLQNSVKRCHFINTVNFHDLPNSSTH